METRKTVLQEAARVAGSLCAASDIDTPLCGKCESCIAAQKIKQLAEGVGDEC